VVLTPYLGQLARIKDAMRSSAFKAVLSDMDNADILKEMGPAETEPFKPFENGAAQAPAAGAAAPQKGKNFIRCASVDNFQGEEADIVIASLVRSNSGGQIGFLYEPERVNVLMSRARMCMIVFGNAGTFLNARRPEGRELWSKMLQGEQPRASARDNPTGAVLPRAAVAQAVLPIYEGLPVICQPHGKMQLCPTPQSFTVVCPDGGCDQPCGKPLPRCQAAENHGCQRRCHPRDDDHLKQECSVQVVVPCSSGEHRVQRACSSSSTPRCNEKVRIPCDAGHQREVACADRKKGGVCKACDQLRQEAEKLKRESEARLQEQEEKITALQTKLARERQETESLRESEMDLKGLVNKLEQELRIKRGKKFELEHSEQRPTPTRPSQAIAAETAVTSSESDVQEEQL
jgi:hypothetical protein